MKRLTCIQKGIAEENFLLRCFSLWCPVSHTGQTIDYAIANSPYKQVTISGAVSWNTSAPLVSSLTATTFRQKKAAGSLGLIPRGFYFVSVTLSISCPSGRKHLTVISLFVTCMVR